MSTPVITDSQSTLKLALTEVQATLSELLTAAGEQYSAVADGDRQRLEGVTRWQERLAARLERAERKRVDAEAIVFPNADQEISALRAAIAAAVGALQERNAQNASLLQRSLDLNSHTLEFLQRLVTRPQTPVYGVRGVPAAQRSVLVDSRA
jgi:flagellar biosynthesis/type III secretory pathway chaperone